MFHQLWIRQETEKGHMIVKWIPTSQQQADGFTKLLPQQLFEAFMEVIITINTVFLVVVIADFHQINKLTSNLCLVRDRWI